MVKVIPTFNVRHLLHVDAVDGLYTSDAEQPSDEELLAIEKAAKEYKEQKRKYRENKTFGMIEFNSTEHSTKYKNRAEQLKAEKEKKDEEKKGKSKK